ncbi:CBS domain-containing protein [Streptomyces silvisoli]|uniref:CBS domain-containing protein n=1 Tax=Streptomyces silvisoli TaxID=3034235 RepID=A0ABT5ZUV5_9ACTN|nr:CBS domain-containing protein [Streptomyces silvisoli]MDF3293612.1 CBS domain-containing protein [Streptomyces silvisoli]
MRHRNVSDLMTTSVITARRDTTFKEIAGLLAEHDITAVPVVDDNDRPVGMVSEADLLRKQAGQPDPAGLLAEAFERSEPGTDAWHADMAKAAATSAEWLMTTPVVTARPEWTVVEAARVMEQHKVKRLPVVNEAGQLVGLVSRADLLRVFLRRDQAIREEIMDDVLLGTLRLAPTDVSVNVVDGQVSLTGTVERRSLVPLVARLCRGVDGVVSVDARLQYRHDDSSGA